MSIDKKTNGKSNEKVNERNAQKKSATAGGEKMIPKLAHNEPLGEHGYDKGRKE